MTGPGVEWDASMEAAKGADAPSWHWAEAALKAVAAQEAEVRAWTHVADVEALSEGRAAPPEGPLHGLPFGVKDVIDVAGMPTRCGSAAAPEGPAAVDASCVSLLRRAGAVPIGKTVTAEYAFRTPGPTNNPRAPGHTPGGSSSGSAAAVAAGMVPFALGTQTGGSMIRPAAYCGVAGFKPSFGAVFRDGLTQTCESLDVIGWHSCSIAVAQAVARVLLPYPLPAADAPALPRRVAVVASSPGHALEPEGARALQDARRALEARDIACIDVDFEQAARIDKAHGTLMHFEFARSLEPVARLHAGRLSASVLDTIRLGFEVPAEAYLEARHRQAEWRMQWAAMFGDTDLILTPSAPAGAPKGMANTGSSAFNRIWSLLGWPCLHVPMGRSATGLPVGVQLVGPFEADHEVLRWAGAVQPLLLQAQPT